MEATIWSDFVCPWCYFGQDRSQLLRAMGITVIQLPYELHPDTPIQGIALTARAQQRFAEIHAQADDVALPFRIPRRSPNSRLALEVSVAVSMVAESAFETVSAAFFHAHFVDGDDIGDPDVLYRLVEAGGADPDRVQAIVDGGGPAQAVAAARMAAEAAGVVGVPGWLVDGRLLIPGLQPRATIERLVGRILARRP